MLLKISFHITYGSKFMFNIRFNFMFNNQVGGVLPFLKLVNWLESCFQYDTSDNKCGK